MLKSKESRTYFALGVAIIVVWTGMGTFLDLAGGWTWWFFAAWMAIPFASILFLAIVVGIFFLVLEWIEHGTD